MEEQVLIREVRITLSYLPYASVPRVYTQDGRIVQLDAVSFRVWELCDGSRKIKDIITEVSRESSVSRELVRRVVQQLLRAGILRVVSFP